MASKRPRRNAKAKIPTCPTCNQSSRKPPPSLSASFFNDLPPELKDIIWEFAINAIPSRVVALNFFKNQAPIPALLHACSRSRLLSLRRWQLIEEAPIPWTPEAYFAGYKLFVDFQNDILLLAASWYQLAIIQSG